MKFYRILILTICAYTLISCGGADERKSVYMEKAKASIAAGDLEKARIELKNVLQIDPKDGEAYYQVGSVYEQQKNYRKAYSNYLKAEELSPELLANHARLGRFYLVLMNDVDKAQEKMSLILSKEPNNIDGLLLKASVLLRTGDKGKNSEVIKLVESIIADNPGDVEASGFLATLHISDKNNKDAINVLDAALEKNKNTDSLNNLLGMALIADENYERAEIIFKQFLEENPDSSASYNKLAIFYGKIKEMDKAEDALRASIDNDPNDETRILTLVKFLKQVKGDDDAIKELRSSIAANNRLGKPRLALAELLLLKGEKEEAATVYNKIVTDFSEEGTGVLARTALAAIYASDKKFDEATDIIDDAISISPSDPKVNFLRAKLALRDKDYEKAIISLRIVTKETPDNIEAFILLANVYKQQNNVEQVATTLNSAYESNQSNADGLLTLSQYYLKNNPKQAEKIIDDYNQMKPRNYKGLSVKAAILNKNKQQDEALNIAKIIMEQYPDKSNGYLQAIPYYALKNDFSSAISLLEKGYLNVKENRKILMLLTSLEVKEKNFDIVEKRLNAELNSSPKDDQIKIMLAKVHFFKKETEAAETLLSEVMADNSGIEEPYLLLSDIYQSKKDLISTKAILVKGRSNIKGSLKIAMKLSALYEREESYKKAIEIYQDLYDINPNNLLIANNLASMLSNYGDGSDDLKRAKSIAEKLAESNQPVFLDTIGWVYYKLGDHEKAIEYLLKTVEKQPDVNIFNYHLGMAYKLSGDKAKAKIYLEKSLSDKKPFKQMNNAKAVLKKL